MDMKQDDPVQETLAMLELLAESQERLAKTGLTYSTAEVRRRAKAALEKASSGR